MRKVPEVSHEVGLVGVSVRGGNIRQFNARLVRWVFQAVQYRTEAPDARIQLRRQPNSFDKQPLQLPLAEVTSCRQIADSDVPAAEVNLRDSVGHDVGGPIVAMRESG